MGRGQPRPLPAGPEGHGHRPELLANLGLACKLDSDKAVVVESVKAGFPADAGKLKAGDVLQLVNLRRVKSPDKVEELFRYAMMDGPKAKVTTTRGKESLDLEILFP